MSEDFKHSIHDDQTLDQINSSKFDREWKHTFGTIDQLKSNILHLAGVLQQSTGESMQMTMLYEGDIDIPSDPARDCHSNDDESNQLLNIPNQVESKLVPPAQIDTLVLENQLTHLREAITVATRDLDSNAGRLDAIWTEISNIQIKTNLDFNSELALSKKSLEQFVNGKLFKVASSIRSGLFAEIRTLNSQPLEQCVLDLIGNYENLVCQHAELQTKYEELVEMKSNSANFPTLLNQTSVFELLERETANSVKEVEQLRLHFESELNQARTGWQCERAQLVADLKDSEGLVSDLRKTLVQNKRDWDEKLRTISTDYTLLQRQLDSCCSCYLYSSIDSSKVGSIERLKAFFNRLDACCPWIWEAVEQSANSTTTTYLPNPNLLAAEHEKKLNSLILERNDLEDQLHQIRKEIHDLRESHLQMTTELESKNRQIDQLVKESHQLNKRVNEQRNSIKRLLNPQTAEAFLAMLRSGYQMHNRSDSNTSGSTTSSLHGETPGLVAHPSSVTPVMHSINSQNSPTCVTALPGSDITSDCMTMNLSATRVVHVPATTQSPSVLSRVGAAVSAIASAVISPKRRLSSLESSGSKPRSVVSPPVHLNPMMNPVVSDEPKILGPIEEPSHKRVRSSPTPQDNPMGPPVSSNAPFSIFAMPNMPDLGRNPRSLKPGQKRRPLSEIPITSGETTSSHGSLDSNPVVSQSTKPFTKPFSIPTETKPEVTTKKHISDLDFVFLSNGPLAESTAQLPQNFFTGDSQPKPFGIAPGIQQQHHHQQQPQQHQQPLTIPSEPSFSPIDGRHRSSKQFRPATQSTGLTNPDGVGSSQSRPSVPYQSTSRQIPMPGSKYSVGHQSPQNGNRKSPFMSPPITTKPVRTMVSNPKPIHTDPYSQKAVSFGANPTPVGVPAESAPPPPSSSSRPISTQLGQPKKPQAELAQECITS